MPKTASAQIAVIGIDIGKNSFHVVGHDKPRFDRPAPEVVARSDRGAARQHHRLASSAWRRASARIISPASSPRFGHDARLMPAKYVRPYAKGPEERLQRCRGDRRSRAAADDEVRRREDRRSTRPSGAASRARAAGLAAHRHHQSDPCLHAGTRHRRAPGHPLPARRAADHPRLAHRRSVSAHAARHRRPRRRLAAPRRAHREPLARDRNDCPTGYGLRPPR